MIKNREVIFLFLFLFLIPLTSAELHASVTTPSATFRVNQRDIINHYIGVENNNVYPVNVSIFPPENINIIFIDGLNYTLESGESRKINYTIKADKSGNFSEFIGISFKSDEGNIGLQAKIILKVYEKEVKNWIFYVLGIVFILIVIYLFLLKIKSKHRNLNKEEKVHVYID